MRTHPATFVIGAALVLGAAPPAAAQETDRTKVLYEMANSLGMLRSLAELDSLMTLEAWGRGTMRDVTATGVGPEAQLKSVYIQIAYDVPGMRTELVRTDGQRLIRVVSGTHAWDEIGQLGGGLEPGYGSATPAMNTLGERLLNLWLTPAGVVKAARSSANQAAVTVENGRSVVTFPLLNAAPPTDASNMVVGPLNGTPVKLTLDADYRPARAEVTLGGRKHVVTYSGYADLNEADYKSDVFLPNRFIHTVDGQTVMDLTIDKTNTYNPYVIMPVPPAVRQAK